MTASRQELARFLRFCIVGVANTAVHIAVVWALVELVDWRPTHGNMAAFIVANLFSFLVNSRWTFADHTAGQSRRALLARYPRFLAVSLTGLALSWACVALAEAAGLHYMIGVVGSVFAVAVTGYALNRLFVFRSPTQG